MRQMAANRSSKIQVKVKQIVDLIDDVQEQLADIRKKADVLKVLAEREEKDA